MNQMIDIVGKLSTDINDWTLDNVHKLDAAFKLSECQHPEVKCDFLSALVSKEHEPAVDEAIDFISKIGRMKFVLPIMKSLFNKYPDRARQTFENNKGFY